MNMPKNVSDGPDVLFLADLANDTHFQFTPTQRAAIREAGNTIRFLRQDAAYRDYIEYLKQGDNNLDGPCQKKRPVFLKISPIFAWYDLWVGLFWDRKKRWLYILPIPCIGVIVKFPNREGIANG